jgi:hypothetical protein
MLLLSGSRLGYIEFTKQMVNTNAKPQKEKDLYTIFTDRDLKATP